jgi:hypothetical protein
MTTHAVSTNESSKTTQPMPPAPKSADEIVTEVFFEAARALETMKGRRRHWRQIVQDSLQRIEKLSGDYVEDTVAAIVRGDQQTPADGESNPMPTRNQ